MREQLMWAVLNKNENVVRLLPRYKPNLAAKNDMGYSVADYVKLLGWEREFAHFRNWSAESMSAIVL